MKRTTAFWVLLAIPLLYGCQSHEEKPRTLRQVYTYPYFEAGIDDLPPVDEIKAIVLTGDAPPYLAGCSFLVGNRKAVETILGHEIWADITFDNRQWIERLTTHFKNAERLEKERHIRPDFIVIFFTASKGYVIPMEEGCDTIFGSNFSANQPAQDFADIREQVPRRPKGQLKTLPKPVPANRPRCRWQAW